ncbi:MAG: flagellar basal body rod protein FlgB [Treponema sp.]|jgi:flagellar basal-body rod protein FlgB|nr:flagellar basal body rod protein FlgB [Treponema sp.]
MIGNNTFTKTVDILHRGMSTSSLRQAVIANNLANADVPNFKRTDVNFESELKRALDTEKYRPALELRRTHPTHIADWEPRDYRDVKPRRVLDYLTQSDNNGNNVDQEEEFNLLLKNQLRYMLLADMANFEFSQVTMVLRG